MAKPLVFLCDFLSHKNGSVQLNRKACSNVSSPYSIDYTTAREW